MLKVTRRFAVLVVFVFLAAPVEAAITGEVLDQSTNDPIEGARVRVQATPGEPVITDALGQFTLELENPDPFEPVRVTAAVTYDSSRDVNYIVGYLDAVDGDEITISLTSLVDDNPDDFQPTDPNTCNSCHANQYNEWQNSNHSHATENEWVLDLFADFRDTHDADDTGFCATCHAPLQDALGGGVMLDDKQVQDDASGVDCQACHLMAEINDNFSALHHEGNAQYYFPQGSSPLRVMGPLDDVTDYMLASFQPQFSQAEFCASCHEYDNPNNPGIPGQTTYSEWKESPFGPEGENRPCQSCHMPGAEIEGPIASIGGPIRPPEQRRSHEFTGATPTTLSDAIDLDIGVDQQDARLIVNAEVANNGAGHYFPTGISIRNGILHIEAEYDGQPLPQTTGPVVPFYGSASDGTDPDRDLAGRPGRGFARVLEGRINGGGPTVYPVLFIDAENVREETRIPSGESDLSSYRFDLSGVPEGATVEVSARLLYRRAWRDLEVRKGWTETPAGGPIEIEVQAESRNWVVQELPLDEIFFDRFEDLGN